MSKRTVDSINNSQNCANKKRKTVKKGSDPVRQIPEQVLVKSVEKTELTMKNSCKVEFEMSFTTLRNIVETFKSVGIKEIVLHCDSSGIIFNESNSSKTSILISTVSKKKLIKYEASTSTNEFFNINLNTNLFSVALETMIFCNTCSVLLSYDKEVHVKITGKSTKATKVCTFSYEIVDNLNVQIPKELMYQTAPELVVTMATGTFQSVMRIIKSKLVLVKCSLEGLDLEWEHEKCKYVYSYAHEPEKCEIVDHSVDKKSNVLTKFSPSDLYSVCKHMEPMISLLEESTISFVLNNNRPLVITGYVGADINITAGISYVEQ